MDEAGATFGWCKSDLQLNRLFRARWWWRVEEVCLTIWVGGQGCHAGDGVREGGRMCRRYARTDLGLSDKVKWLRCVGGSWVMNVWGKKRPIIIKTRSRRRICGGGKYKINSGKWFIFTIFLSVGHPCAPQQHQTVEEFVSISWVDGSQEGDIDLSEWQSF